MSKIGEILKSKRIQKGLSLKQLSDCIKIRQNYLEIIEDNLEGNVDPYIKGYVKIYANYLNLNLDHLLKNLKSNDSNNLTKQQNSVDSQDDDESNWLGILQKSISFALACLVIFTVFHLNERLSFNFDKFNDSKNHPLRQKKSLHQLKISNYEHIITNIKGYFYIISNEPGNIEILDEYENITDKFFLKFGEKKLISTNNTKIKIKTSIPNAIDVSQN